MIVSLEVWRNNAYNRYVMYPAMCQSTPMDYIKDVVRSSVKVPEFDKHLKKAGGHIDRNLLEITIKIKSIVRKPVYHFVRYFVHFQILLSTFVGLYHRACSQSMTWLHFPPRFGFFEDVLVYIFSVIYFFYFTAGSLIIIIIIILVLMSFSPQHLGVSSWCNG